MVGEQGLGDEFMFANILPDIQDAVGEDGRMQIAVDPRLIPLFQRSFPRAEVGTYDDRTLVDADGNKALRLIPFATKDNKPDLWAPMGTVPAALPQVPVRFPARQAVPDRRPRAGCGVREKLAALPGNQARFVSRSLLTHQRRSPLLRAQIPQLRNIRVGSCVGGAWICRAGSAAAQVMARQAALTLRIKTGATMPTTRVPRKQREIRFWPTLRYMRTQPVSCEKMTQSSFGHSAGGWGALFLAEQDPKSTLCHHCLRAGAQRGRANDRADSICAPDKLLEAAGSFGEGARIPVTWLVAENDSYFSPAFSQRMADAFRNAGGKVDFRVLPRLRQRRALAGGKQRGRAVVVAYRRTHRD